MTETRIEDTAVCYASFHVGSQYQPCLAKCWMVHHWVYHSMITTQLYHHWLVVLNYARKSEPSQPIIPSIVENNKWIYIYIIISIYIYIYYNFNIYIYISYIHVSNHQANYSTTSSGFTTISLLGGFLNHRDTPKSSKSL